MQLAAARIVNFVLLEYFVTPHIRKALCESYKLYINRGSICGFIHRWRSAATLLATESTEEG